MKQKAIIISTALLLLSGCQSGVSTSQNVQSDTSSRDQTRSTTIEKKMYRNEQYGFQVDLPASWSVDQKLSNRAYSGEDIFFDTGTAAGENHEGIKIDILKEENVDDVVKKIDKSIIANISDIIVDGEKGKKVDTTEFGQSIVVVQHGSFIYQFTTGGGMITEGVLASLRFLR